MADAPDDRFRRYYAEKLWDLIPPIYRHEDGIAKQPGVLRALVEVLAEQAAHLRRSSDRLWDDQLIDFCDDWAVPYLGDLVGTRMVSALDRRARRADVANTIYYRRRAGTLAVLEGLVADITGWEGTVVEEFRRLVRHPHGLDPTGPRPAPQAEPVGSPPHDSPRLIDPAPARTGRITGTPAHGLPDLRHARTADLAWTAWDELHHLPDVRRNHGGLDGRHGITRLAFHLFRLLAYRVDRVTPRRLAPDAGGRVRFAFDPSGRTIPLYQRRGRASFDTDWRAAREWELPAEMRCEVLAHAEFAITEALILAWRRDGVITPAQADELRPLRGIRFPNESRFRIRLGVALTVALGTAALRRILADALVADCGKGALLPAPAAGTGDTWSVQVEEPIAAVLTPVPREVIVAGNLTAALPSPADKSLVIDAENGLGYFTAGAPPAGVLGSYCYGFSGPIGAGSYDRTGLARVPAAGRISGGGAIAAPAAAPAIGLEIDDSLTYGPVADLSVQQSLLLQARDERRPYLELAGDWTLTAAQIDSELVLDGLWIGGRGPRTIRLAAAPPAGSNNGWRRVILRRLTCDPGGTDADGGAIGPVLLSIESRVTELVIEASILGGVAVAPAGLVEKLTVRSTIVHSTDPAARPVALSQPRGELDIRGATVIGGLRAHRLEASELLCTGAITVDDVQAGCIRFSAFPPGSAVPRAYRTQPLADAHSLFSSQRFGDPDYCQLSDVVPEAIARGGDDGTEIGAFHALLTPIKLDSLRAKVDELLPFGLLPLYITET
jgi:hypothetical protein